MKLFMGPVLFWMAGRDPLGDDAQAHPPDTELRQTAEARAREWTAIVTADPLRQPVVGKGAFEAASSRLPGSRAQRIAAEHEAAEAVAQRQRIAVRAITGPKFAFEIRCPHLVGPTGRCERRPRHGGRAVRATPWRDQAGPLQQPRDRGSRRPG